MIDDLDLPLEEAKIELSNSTSFVVWTDVGNFLQAAVDNWVARTDDYTAESLCRYITGKGLHRAVTDEQYKIMHASD